MSRSRLSERLTAASLQELTGLFLRSEDPVDSVELVASIFELVRVTKRDVVSCWTKR